MLSTLLVAAVAATAVQDTDRTVPASGISRVDVEQHNGSVVVRSWDRNEIRIQADHSRRVEIDIRKRRSTLAIDSDGMPHLAVRYTITVPARMDLDLEGLKLDVDVEGIDGDIDIEAVQGSVEVRNSSGNLDVETLSGSIDINGFEGGVSASSTSQHITLQRVIGDIIVEAVSGIVALYDIEASSLDVEAISGGIEYTGSLESGGRYSLTSHSGEVTLDLDPGMRLTLQISNHSGAVDMDYPDARLIESRHGEMTFEIGGGGTVVEIETFSGSVRIRERRNR